MVGLEDEDLRIYIVHIEIDSVQEFVVPRPPCYSCCDQQLS
jgi:hypothetical protein